MQKQKETMRNADMSRNDEDDNQNSDSLQKSAMSFSERKQS